MPTVEAQIHTERPSRYLTQICKHAASLRAGHHGPRMHLTNALARRELQLHTDWSDTHGVITFTPWGQCTMTAHAHTLTLCIDAADEENLQKIRDIITNDLNRFSRRDTLTVNWQPAHPPQPPARLPPAAATRTTAAPSTPTHAGDHLAQ
jgi:hypothetical protein